VAAGDLRRPSRRQHADLAAAVARAEATTGLQFSVFLGGVDDAHPREHAEEIFQREGLHALPAVLIVVAPKQRRVEVVTSETARGRISDADASVAVDHMTASFQRGRLTPGVIAALDHLADVAGPGAAANASAEIPDIVDGGDF
jgi:uncharacterized membrane protein YgcG